MTSTERSDFWGVTLMSEFVEHVICGDFWLLQIFDFYVTFEDILGQIVNMGIFHKKNLTFEGFSGETQSFFMRQTVSLTIAGRGVTLLLVGRWLASRLFSFRETKGFNFHVRGLIFFYRLLLCSKP